MRLLAILGVSLLVTIESKDVHPPGGPFTPQCMAGNGSIYDPTKAKEVTTQSRHNFLKVPWLKVDLDQPYDQRYRGIVGPYADDMKRVIWVVKEVARIFLGNNSINSLDQLMQHAYDDLFPYSYKEEIRVYRNPLGISTHFRESPRLQTSLFTISLL